MLHHIFAYSTFTPFTPSLPLLFEEKELTNKRTKVATYDEMTTISRVIISKYIIYSLRLQQFFKLNAV